MLPSKGDRYRQLGGESLAMHVKFSLANHPQNRDAAPFRRSSRNYVGGGVNPAF